MSELGQVATDFFAVCQQHTDAICKLLAPLREGEFKIEWQAPVAKLDDVPSASLLLEWKTGGNQFTLLLPATAAPEWIATPDETQQGVLQKLAGDAASTLHAGAEITNAATISGDATASHVNIAAQAAGVAFLPFDLAHGEESATGYIIAGAATTSTDSAGDAATPQEATHAEAPATQPPKPAAARNGQLPHYTKSLLKIRVPVSVSLATTQMPVQRILEIGAGSIIQFSKSCEESLTLHAGTQAIAEGEAVKVGDKFGFRISHMTTPQERFLPVGPKSS